MMFQIEGMPSDEATKLVHDVIDVLQSRRLDTLTADAKNPKSEKPMSLRHLAKISNLDLSALSRAEEKDRIPSLAFFVDWARALDTSLEEVVAKARQIGSSD